MQTCVIYEMTVFRCISSVLVENIRLRESFSTILGGKQRVLEHQLCQPIRKRTQQGHCISPFFFYQKKSITHLSGYTHRLGTSVSKINTTKTLNMDFTKVCESIKAFLICTKVVNSQRLINKVHSTSWVAGFSE